MGDKKDWTGKSRFALLVTDSPCHGTKYHDLGRDEDNFPEMKDIIFKVIKNNYCGFFEIFCGES